MFSHISTLLRCRFPVKAQSVKAKAPLQGVLSANCINSPDSVRNIRKIGLLTGAVTDRTIKEAPTVWHKLSRFLDPKSSARQRRKLMDHSIAPMCAFCGYRDANRSRERPQATLALKTKRRHFGHRWTWLRTGKWSGKATSPHRNPALALGICCVI